MKNEISLRLDALRSLMSNAGIAATIIPKTDPHQSEYISDHWQSLKFLSGFTGSAGTLVVTADRALMWTDSRYFIQAANQLEGTPVELMKDGLRSTPSINDFLVENLAKGDAVGIDGMLFSALSVESLRSVLDAHGLRLVTDFDVIDRVWTDRPSLPKDPVFVHDIQYAGQPAGEKLAEVLANTRSQMADTAFVSPLDEIAWTLNIRCNDVRYNPVATAYLYVAPGVSTLFIDEDKVDDALRQYLAGEGVDVEPYDSVKSFISALPDDLRVLAPRATTSATLCSLLGDRAVAGTSPVAVPKGCRNDVQIQGLRQAMVRDGVALVKAFKELDEKMAAGEAVTELDFDAMLLKYRREQPLFFDESFGSIVGYGPNGAIVHYEPTPESNATLHPQGLLLVDSGAQYLDGTTDITRTVCLGTPTPLEKHDFTLVLKGCIALDRMVFPVGTRGAQLDVEARKFLWREGLTYLHGTGHGVGHFLNVHEGPQTIRLNDTPIPLMLGMVTSDEPGLYREGVHGVRCENLVLCVKAMSTDFGEFLKFETLTLFPFDTKLMETEIMSPDEIAWVNDYHAAVYERLSPHLSDAERAWLASKTAPVSSVIP